MSDKKITDIGYHSMKFLILTLFIVSIKSSFAGVDLSDFKHKSRYLAEYSIFKIDIQYISLLSTKKYNTPTELIDSNDKKAIKIEYLRDLSQKIIRQAWDVSYETVLSKPELEAFSAQIDKIKSIARDVKKKDEVVVIFDSSGLDYFFNGKLLARIDDKKFADLTLGIWIGEKAVDDDMKKAMLKNSLHSKIIKSD